jgi:hypothetical protein
MAVRNPFADGNGSPQQSIKGDNLINIKRERIVRIPDADGTIREIRMDNHESAPDGTGVYTDTETVNIATDSSGRVIPDDPRSVKAISHTGACITQSDPSARCTSWFHPADRPNNILVGHDGVLLTNGARCSHCQRIFVRVVFGLTGAGVVFLLGLYKAAGFF